MVSASATPYQKSALSRQIALTEVYEQVSANTEASFRMRLDWCTPKKKPGDSAEVIRSVQNWVCAH